MEKILRCVCQCATESHQVSFEIDSEIVQFYVVPRLNDYLPWYKRIVNAVKYVFAIKNRDDDYDCVCLTDSDAISLHEMLTPYVERVDDLASY